MWFSIFKKALVALLGLITAFVMLELALCGYSLLEKYQAQKMEKSSKASATTSGTYTILCIGESITAGTRGINYPVKLQQDLNLKYPETKFNVVNGGVYRSTIHNTLDQFPAKIKLFKPNMVIAMLGINDLQNRFTRYHIKTRINPSPWNRLRSIYLLRSLWLELKQKRQMPQPESNDFDSQILHYMQKKLRHCWFGEDGNLLTGIMMENAPDKKSEMFWSALALGLSKHFPPAVKLLQQAIDQDMAFADTYILLALCLRKDQLPDKIDELRKLSRKACKTDSDHYLRWGFWSEQFEKFPKAIENYEKALKSDPANPELITAFLAQAQRRNGEYAKSWKTTRELLKTNPKNTRALWNMAKLAQHYNRARTMIQRINDLTAIDPKHSKAWYLKGKFYADTKQWEKAKNCLETAQRLFPGTTLDSNSLLKVVYWNLKQTGQTKTTFLNDKKQVRSATRNFVEAYLRIGALAFENNIQLVCMQYPQRPLKALQSIFPEHLREKIIFVDNEKTFKKALEQHEYHEIFIDAFAGNLGHCTQKGCDLMVENIIAAIGDEFEKPLNKKE